MIMLMKRKPDGLGAIPAKRRKDRKPSKCLSTSNYLEEKPGHFETCALRRNVEKIENPGRVTTSKKKPGHFETCALVYKIER